MVKYMKEPFISKLHLKKEEEEKKVELKESQS